MAIPPTAAAEDIAATAVARAVQFTRPPFSEETDALTRRFLTPAHRAAIDQLSAWMMESGITPRLDAAGTLRGRWGEGPALVIGSHIDSVRNAGAFDGTLGVMLALGVIAEFAKRGEKLPFALELAAFGDEEGSRFHASMVGSRAFAGALREDVRDYKDSDGITLTQAFADFGLDADRIAEAARKPNEVLLYLEPHIEQGPVLQAENLPVGVVTGIAAQTRLAVTLTGMANHAGTTPMGMRRDALAGAAEAITAVEHIGHANAMVATVGQLSVWPNVSNVIPGLARFSADLRHLDHDVVDGAEAALRGAVDHIATSRDLRPEINVVQRLQATPCDAAAIAQLSSAIESLDLPVRALPSGAGHDAMSVASLCPVAMIFIRCKDGVSHHPDESVAIPDVAVAAEVMLRFIESTMLLQRNELGLTAAAPVRQAG